LKNFFSQLIQFVKSVAADSRIPDRDKKVLAGLVLLIASPFDIIPDWIPIIGVLDDFVILAIVLDYLFNVLDSEIILSHYPWGMKSYTRIRAAAKLIALFAPNFIKAKIWNYVGRPY
jgi:hypothetical protein